jgi:hypothetical protein
MVMEIIMKNQMLELKIFYLNVDKIMNQT